MQEKQQMFLRMPCLATTPPLAVFVGAFFVGMTLSIQLYLSIYLSIYPSIYLSIHLPLFIYIYLSIYAGESTDLFQNAPCHVQATTPPLPVIVETLFVGMPDEPIYLCTLIYLSIYLSIYVHLSIHLFIYLSIYLYLYIYLSIYAGESTDLFTHALYSHYSTPGGFCWDSFCGDEPIIDNPNIPDYNVPDRVETFINYVHTQAQRYRSNNIIVLFGDDFQYKAAHKNYKNIDKLIRYFRGVFCFWDWALCRFKCLGWRLRLGTFTGIDPITLLCFSATISSIRRLIKITRISINLSGIFGACFVFGTEIVSF